MTDGDRWASGQSGKAASSRNSWSEIVSGKMVEWRNGEGSGSARRGPVDGVDGGVGAADLLVLPLPSIVEEWKSAILLL